MQLKETGRWIDSETSKGDLQALVVIRGANNHRPHSVRDSVHIRGEEGRRQTDAFIRHEAAAAAAATADGE